MLLPRNQNFLVFMFRFSCLLHITIFGYNDISSLHRRISVVAVVDNVIEVTIIGNNHEYIVLYLMLLSKD